MLAAIALRFVIYALVFSYNAVLILIFSFNAVLLLFFFAIVIFILNLIFGFGICATLALGAGGAIVIAVADNEFRRHFVSVSCGFQGFDCFAGQDFIASRDILRSDLEAVEKEAGSLGLEPPGAECAEDLGEGELDGAAIFQDWEFERLKRGSGLLRGEAMDARVEIAKGFAGHRVRSALDTVGHDVTALHVHLGYPPTPLFLQRSGLFSSGYEVVVAANVGF
jgi:hypothetical protein